MTTIINKIKKILSDKRVTFLILAISIISRLVQLIFFFNIVMDASFQYIATKNLVAGHSTSLDIVLPSDLSTVFYEPLFRWPVGYSWLLAPFYLLFGKNYIAAGLTLSILAGITLIFVTRAILKVLNVPVYFINIYTLVVGFFIYHFYFICSSDAIAIAFFFLAFYYTISLLKKNDRWGKKTIFITICLFMCGAIKYLFIPVVFVVPAFLLLKGYADRQIAVRRAGIYSFSALAVLLGMMLGYQEILIGSVGYISAPGRGFFPKHLLAEYPFAPASLIRSETISLLFPNQPSLEPSIYHVFQAIHVLFLAGVIFFILKSFFNKGIKGISTTGNFFYLSVFTCLAITALLATLSLFVEEEVWSNGHHWTYIEGQRYYGTAFVLMHMGLFVGYSNYYAAKRRKLLRYLFYFLLLLLLAETARGLIFDAHRILKFKKEEYSWQYENRFQKFAEEIIKKERGKTFVVVTGSTRYFNNRVSLYSHVPVFLEATRINEPKSLKTKAPLLLLVILRENDLPGFQRFLATKEKKLAGNFDDFYFYKLYVNPH